MSFRKCKISVYSAALELHCSSSRSKKSARRSSPRARVWTRASTHVQSAGWISSWSGDRLRRARPEF